MRIFVTEFADSKKNMERELKPKTKQIINHLYKLYCMPDHESRNHWMREIANFLNEINKCLTAGVLSSSIPLLIDV